MARPGPVELLAYLRTVKRATVPQIMCEFGVCNRTARRWLYRLEQNGLAHITSFYPTPYTWAPK